MWQVMVQVIGGILGVFLSLPVASGEVRKVPPTDLSPRVGSVQRFEAKSDVGKRRDPFRPIIKQRAISSLPKKAHIQRPTIEAVSVIKNPKWKLLGIIDGQYGRQAVIQVSPQMRVFIKSGLEVAGSGWIIKTISRGEVLLEHSSPTTPGKGLSEPKAFILSFGTFGLSS